MSDLDILWRVWFLVVLVGAGILFVSKFRFGPSYQKRADRRWMLSYSNYKLTPDEEEGRARHIKVTLKDGEELKPPPPPGKVSPNEMAKRNV
jgi:hypothetical protein